MCYWGTMSHADLRYLIGPNIARIAGLGHPGLSAATGSPNVCLALNLHRERQLAQQRSV